MSMKEIKDLFEKHFGKRWMLGEDFTAWEVAEWEPQKPIEFCDDIGELIYKLYKSEIPEDEDEFADLVWG